MGCAASRPSNDDVATAPETTTEPSSPVKPSLAGVGSSDQAFDELDLLSTPSARTTGSSSVEDGPRHAKQDAAGPAVSALPPKSGLYWHFLPPSQQQAALCEVASKATVETDTLPRWGESITSSLLALGSSSAVVSGTALATTTPYPANVEVNFRLALWEGDVTSLKVDALVRSCGNSTSLIERSGVSGAILDAAGPQLHAACERLGGCKPGEARVTRGFELPAKHVIHTVVPDGLRDTDSLERCYSSSLAVARLLRCRSVAFTWHEQSGASWNRQRAVHVALRAVRLLMEQPNSRCIELIVLAFHTQRPPVPTAPAVPAPASAAPPSAALSPAVAAADAAHAPAAAAAVVTPDTEEDVHAQRAVHAMLTDGLLAGYFPRTPTEENHADVLPPERAERILPLSRRSMGGGIYSGGARRPSRDSSPPPLPSASRCIHCLVSIPDPLAEWQSLPCRC